MAKSRKIKEPVDGSVRDSDVDMTDGESKDSLKQTAEEAVLEKSHEKTPDGADMESGKSKRKRKRKRKKKEDQATEEGSADGSDRSGEAKPTTKAATTSKTLNTVYVEGIPYGTTDDELISYFSKCGPVKSLRLPRYQDTGRIRGYGHVAFYDQAATEAALKLDGKYMKKRYLSIKLAEAPKALAETRKPAKRPANCTTIFIKNISYDATEESVREAFESCGKVVNVRLAVWNDTKRLKGFGYVDFSDGNGAEKAMERGPVEVDGRWLTLDYEVGRPKASFKTKEGRVWAKTVEGKDALAQTKSKKMKIRR